MSPHHHHQDAPPPASSRRPLLSSIYAEYLPKLGRLSIVVHLPTPSTQTTKGLISNGNDDDDDDDDDDASRLIVTHDGVTSELALPVDKTSLRGGESLLGVIPPGLDKLTWGLRPRQPPSGGGISGLGRNAGGEAVVDASVPVVPWSAADLRPGVVVVCRRCEAVVVERGRLQIWKDLPSENWAEMMEFWHCHKPTTAATPTTNNGHKTGGGKEGEKEHDNKASEEALASRGYGANSAIVAQLGVGFVDLTTMLFHPEDSRCAVKATDDNNEQGGKPQSLATSAAASCPGCGTQLGHLDSRKGGVSLFKWKLNLLHSLADNKNNNNVSPPPSLSQCLAAALMANQARSGSAKVVLRGESEAMMVWVLNPHVNFSCLDKPPTTAMKLLYRDKATDEEDELNLPDEAIREIRQALLEGSGYLPRDERVKKFSPKEDAWIVTLLERQG